MVDEFDRLPRPWRDLVNDFGWIIVRDMRLDGHGNAAKLRDELVAWRERKQEQWLGEIPYERIRATAVRSVPERPAMDP